MHIHAVAPAADRLAFLAQRGLFVYIDGFGVQVLHVLGHHSAFGILPRTAADAFASIDAGCAARLDRAEVSAPIRAGGSSPTGQRLAVRISAGNPAKVGAIPLPRACNEEARVCLLRLQLVQAQQALSSRW